MTLLLFTVLATFGALYFMYEKKESLSATMSFPLPEPQISKSHFYAAPRKSGQEKGNIVNSITTENTIENITELKIQREPQPLHDSYLKPIILAAYAKNKENIDNRFKSINGRLAQDPTMSVSDVLGKLFEEEPVEIEWARKNEENIYNFFRDSNNFKNFSPESVDCRSSSCRVVISAADEIASIEIQNKISHQLTINHPAIPRSYSTITDQQTAKLTIYFQ
ncbi:hypothetical protein [Cellvibrio sp. UBA7671]|uniref:hypothetical protein n=1 Tax=Cellvibrio sp. UBA7671 TaxID=1946312 RepID=UPI002F351A8D